MKKTLKQTHSVFSSVFFDPIQVFNKWRGMPYFLKNLIIYKKKNKIKSFDFQWSDAYPILQDRFNSAGSIRGHYFHQDLWAASVILTNNIKYHVDVGSRLDGFIAHILLFCNVDYVDIRPLDCEVYNLKFKQGSITDLPYSDNSVETLSSLHVIEHIGLGRYGDPVNPDGYLDAARELSRVLAVGGRLLIGTPVGRERLCFDAHRVFNPATVIKAFEGLELEEFSLIDDSGNGVTINASFQQAQQCDYGCGLFIFSKKEC